MQTLFMMCCSGKLDPTTKIKKCLVHTIGSLHSTINDMLSRNIIDLACCRCRPKNTICKERKNFKKPYGRNGIWHLSLTRAFNQ